MPTNYLSDRLGRFYASLESPSPATLAGEFRFLKGPSDYSCNLVQNSSPDALPKHFKSFLSRNREWAETIPEDILIKSLEVLDYFTSNRGLVSKKGSFSLRGCSTVMSEQQERDDVAKKLVGKIANYIKNDKPVNIFFFGYFPKDISLNTSNNLLLSDVSEYVSLINLEKINAGLKAIYQPGVRFTVAFEGYLYQKMAKISSEQTDHTFRLLLRLSKSAALMVANSEESCINFVDAKQLSDEFLASDDNFNSELSTRARKLKRKYRKIYHFIAERFEANFTDESTNILPAAKKYELMRRNGKIASILHDIKKDLSGKSGELQLNVLIGFLSEFEKWNDMFRKALPDNFGSAKQKEDYLLNWGFYFRSYQELKYSHNKNGLLKNHDDAILATVRVRKDRLGIQLIPNQNHLTHHTLWRIEKTSKDGKNICNLFPVTHSSITSGEVITVPKYVKGYSHPFYYEALNVEDSSPISISKEYLVFRARDLTSRQLICKLATNPAASEKLERQVDRILYLTENGVTITPEIVSFVHRGSGAVCVLPFYGNKMAKDVLLNEATSVDACCILSEDILQAVNRGLWQKGTTTHLKEYFSNGYLPSLIEVAKFLERLEDDKTYSEEALRGINSVLQILLSNTQRIDQLFEKALSFQFVHGDLHGGNISLPLESGLKLIDFNVGPGRENSPIEHELSRFLGTFSIAAVRAKDFIFTPENSSSLNFEISPSGSVLLAKRDAVMNRFYNSFDLLGIGKNNLTQNESMFMITLCEFVSIAKEYKNFEGDFQRQILAASIILAQKLKPHIDDLIIVGVMKEKEQGKSSAGQQDKIVPGCL